MATGAMANLKWGIEGSTTFKTEATHVDKEFGAAVELSALDMDNDPIGRRGLGSRNIQKFGFGMFKGSFTVAFDLIDPWFLRLVTGGYTPSGSTGNWTHTFGEANILPSFTVYDYVQNIDGLSSTLRKLLGCVVLDAQIDIAVGNEPVRVTLNCAFADVEEAGDVQSWTAPDHDIMIFANAVWQKAGSTVSRTENVTLKINQNTEIKPYLGDRSGQRAKFGDREYECSSIHYFGSTGIYLQDFYGATPSTGPVGTGPIKRDYTLVVTPAAGQTAFTYNFIYQDGYIQKHGQPMKVGEDIMEDVTIMATSLSITAEGWDPQPTNW
jgi:hypothetical protein